MFTVFEKEQKQKYIKFNSNDEKNDTYLCVKIICYFLLYP